MKKVPLTRRDFFLLPHSHNLWVVLELAHGLLSERVRNLRVHPSILNLPVSKMIYDVVDSSAGFQEMYRNRMLY